MVFESTTPDATYEQAPSAGRYVDSAGEAAWGGCSDGGGAEWSKEGGGDDEGDKVAKAAALRVVTSAASNIWRCYGGRNKAP